MRTMTELIYSEVVNGGRTGTKIECIHSGYDVLKGFTE